MGRKYVWHIAYEYEVPYSKHLDVEGNPDLEWREEADPVQPVAEVKVEVAPAPVKRKAPVRRTAAKKVSK